MLDHVVQQLQGGLARPMQVLKDTDDGALLPDGVQQPGERVEQLAPVVAVVTVRRGQIGLVPPYQRGQPQQFGRRIRQARCQGARFRPAQQVLQTLHEGLVGAVRLGRAGAQQHDRARPVSRGGDLRGQPRLARARLAADEDELPCPCADRGPRILRRGCLGGTSDERRRRRPGRPYRVRRWLEIRHALSVTGPPAAVDSQDWLPRREAPATRTGHDRAWAAS
jgi:hypothetical protein